MRTTEPPISESALKRVNIGLHFLHLFIIFFFLFGWLFESTQIAHFILSLAILFSWFGLGHFFGSGYCLVTDMQWKVKRWLNKEPSTEFYIKYMIDKLTGWDVRPDVTNKMTTGVYFGIFALSAILMSIRWFG